MSAMSEHDVLHQALRDILGDALPAEATGHINAALQLAGQLEARGFAFRLLDARPRDPHSSVWKAIFSSQGRIFQVEDQDPALAVCRAALAALQE